MTESAQANSQQSSIIASERGGALIVALLAVVLLMLMGMTLMGVLRSGLIQSSSSEASVQAEVLAQNGLDEALSYIQSVVHNANNNNLHLSYRDRATIVREGLTGLDSLGVTNPLNEWNNKYVETAKGRYKFSIDTNNGMDLEVSQVIKDPNEWPLTFPDRPYVHRVVVKATGISNLKTAQTVVKQMVVYVSSINPVFRYPVSSDADLTLNGAPYILGDMLVRGELNTSNQAEFTISKGSSYRINTELASAKGFIRSANQPARPDQFSIKAVPYPDDGLTLDEDIRIGIKNNVDCVDDPASALCQAAYVNKRIHDGEGLPTINAIVLPLGESESLLGDKQPLESAEVQPNIQATSYDHAVNIKGKLNVGGNLKIDGGILTMEIADDQPKTLPELTADGNIFVGNTTDPDLVAADLTGIIKLNHGPGIDAYMAVLGDTELNNLTLTGGNMFVRGNVTVRGALQIKGTLFVDGNVDFKEVESINFNEDDSPLIVIASGKITLADHRSMKNQSAGCENNRVGNQNCLRAFLYSKEDLSLYGVLSDQVIKGGIHGNNVVLNAVRGEVSLTNADGTYSNQMVKDNYGNTVLTDQFYFKTNQSDATLNSRLQLLYDNMLYTNPPIGIPTIDGEMDVFVKEIRTLPAGAH